MFKRFDCVCYIKANSFMCAIFRYCDLNSTLLVVKCKLLSSMFFKVVLCLFVCLCILDVSLIKRSLLINLFLFSFEILKPLDQQIIRYENKQCIHLFLNSCKRRPYIYSLKL